MTSKGELIRAILFPKPIHFRFYADLIQVAILFLVFGLGGMIYSTYTWIRNGVRTTQILLTKIALNINLWNSSGEYQRDYSSLTRHCNVRRSPHASSRFNSNHILCTASSPRKEDLLPQCQAH